MKEIDDLIMKKNIFWNFLGTTINAFNSLIYMVIVTRLNGTADAGIFTFSFSIACLFCVIGNYEGRVYQVTDIKKVYNDREYILHRYLTCTIMMIFVTFFIFYKGYSFEKGMILFLLSLMKCFEVLADVYYGILQKNDKLYIVGKSLTIKSLLSIIIFLTIDWILKDLLISSLLLAIIWLVLLVVYDIRKTRKISNSEKINYLKVLNLFKSGFFIFIVLFLSIYLVNAPKFALDGRVSDSLQAIFGIILMPATVISLCAQYVLQPFLKELSELYSSRNYHLFLISFFKIFLILLAIGIGATCIAYFMGIPVLSIIYGINLDDYLWPLIIILMGAVFYGLGTLLTSVLTIMRYTFIQALIIILVSVLGTIMSIYLIDSFQLYGASYAYFLIMIIQFLLLGLAFVILFNKEKKIGE